jgi:hypothetical protein
VTNATSVVRRREVAGERRAMSNVDMGCSSTASLVLMDGPSGLGWGAFGAGRTRRPGMGTPPCPGGGAARPVQA